MDDLVEQVVVKVGGCGKTQKLDGERGDEAQCDTGRTQDDEHRQMVRVGLRVLKKTTNFQLTYRPKDSEST